MRILKRDLSLYEPVPMNEMAYTKSQMAAKIVQQTNSIIEWWGFLYYMAHYSEWRELTNHEKGKLRGLLVDLCEDEVDNGKSSKVKRDALSLHWGKGNKEIPGKELLSNVSRVSSIIENRLKTEKVEYTDDMLLGISQAFISDAPTIMDMITDGTKEDIFEYMDLTFPSDVMPQKKKRGVKRRRNGK